MSCGPVEKFVAKSKMRLKNSNHCLSFVTTIWGSEVIMCTFNNLDKSIVDVYCTQTMQPDDFEELEQLVSDFIFTE